MKINIDRKNIKNVKIRVEDGVVKISAPKNLSTSHILDIYESNEAIVEKLIEDDKKRSTYKNHLFGEKLRENFSQKEIDDLYRKELSEILFHIFKKYEKLTGLAPKEYKLRKMKARWGTAYPNKRLIILNIYLAQRPIEEIEAVVLHELIHLKYPNHSKDFYKEIEKYMPNYRDLDKKLKHT